MKKKSSTSTKKKSTPGRSVRFNPDPLTLAVIFPESKKAAQAGVLGLVLNESFGGCSILINHDGGFKKDEKVKIKVGRLSIMEATIVWIKNLEESIFKVGLRFTEAQ